MLRVRLLGELRVERDGAEVPLPASAARVLAYLALRPDAGDRDTVAATLWPDTGRDNARANLRTALWSLRRALGGDAVVASRGSVRLSTELVCTDLAELAGTPHGDAAATEALSTSDALSTCDVLSGLDDEWAAEARAAHRDRQVELLDRLAERADADADVAGAVRWSRRRCAATPLDEPAHRALLRRLAAAG
ncbi:MAG: hypothetical protein QOE32_2190, partial [Pseudonocardiales bacterium]|nr:hypothetical protein [Pseudonocardiales bacterium]